MATFTISYPGPPADGPHDVFDVAIDPNGITWSCTVTGKPGTWVEGIYSSQLNDSSGRAAFSTPTPTTGSAFTPLATGDCLLYIKCTTSTTIVVTMGPTTGAENSVIASVTAPVGGFYSIRVPKNWAVIVTATIADFTFRAQAL